MKKVILGTVLAMVLATPLMGFAQGTIVEPTPSDCQDVDCILGVFETVLDVLYTLFFILAVIMFLYAAFLYLTAGGSEEKTGKAKQILVYGVIAIVVALLAWSIPAIVADLLGA